MRLAASVMRPIVPQSGAASGLPAMIIGVDQAMNQPVFTRVESGASIAEEENSSGAGLGCPGAQISQNCSLIFIIAD